MRKLLVAILVLSSTAAAFAQRPSTLSMSCRQAQAVVARAGGVVLSTGAHTYDRFVVSDRFCLPGEYTYPATAPTKDTSACRIGFTCNSTRPPWLDFDGLRRGNLFSD
jgi:hypothetical protein